MDDPRADLHGLTDLHAYPYPVKWHGQTGTALAYIDEAHRRPPRSCCCTAYPPGDMCFAT